MKRTSWNSVLWIGRTVLVLLFVGVMVYFGQLVWQETQTLWRRPASWWRNSCRWR